MASPRQSNDKRKRLNLAVKREFQLWLMVRIVGVITVSALVAVLVLYFYSHREISSSFYAAHIELRRVSDLLLPVMAAGALVSLISGTILALFLPQKIAGPLHRIQKTLEEVEAGDLTQLVVLRKKDVFHDLARSVNSTTAELRARILEIKAIQAELDAAISTLEHQQARAISTRQQEALARLHTQGGKSQH